jgi:hypothetical protein
MTTFLVDDQIVTNEKIAVVIDVAGAKAIGLWSFVGAACSGQQTHGVVSPSVINSMARALGMTARDRDEAIAALTKDIWHPAARVRRCGPCSAHVRTLDLKVPAGSFLWHGWNDQPWNAHNLKDPTEKLKAQRKKKLHNTPNGQAIKAAVRQRDGDVCCYCDTSVNFSDRVSDTGGTYDHLVPNLLDGPNFVRGNGMENLVVACQKCNVEKDNRTPEEWVKVGGRRLLRDPRPRGDS